MPCRLPSPSVLNERDSQLYLWQLCLRLEYEKGALRTDEQCQTPCLQAISDQKPQFRSSNSSTRVLLPTSLKPDSQRDKQTVVPASSRREAPRRADDATAPSTRPLIRIGWIDEHAHDSRFRDQFMQQFQSL